MSVPFGVVPARAQGPGYGPHELLANGDWSAWAPDPYEVMLTVAGLAFLGAVVLPRVLRSWPLSLPILYVAAGALIFRLPLGLGLIDPLRHAGIVERATELVVIVALTGAGLKLDRPLSWRGWANTWGLLAITMPATIALAATAGVAWLGLAPAAAVLLGAALAPTDPVLASDVQVGPPGEDEEEHEVRFALTSEAGLNDGLAFPFTNLAIAIAALGLAPGSWLGPWLAIDVVYKIAAGAAIGWSLGRVLSAFIFRLRTGHAIARAMEGSMAIAITLTAYGVTELAHGYGFIGTFVAAYTLRHTRREHAYHGALFQFTEDVERLLLAALLILLGGAVAHGVLGPLTAADAGFVAVMLLLIRPAAGLLGTLGRRQPGRDRLVIAAFGIRGIGSLYYLAYALAHGPFAADDAARLWAIVVATVLGSIVLHGVTVTPVMRWVDGREAGTALSRRDAAAARGAASRTPAPRP